MSKIFSVLLFCLSVLQGFSQQVPFYNHNIQNPFIFNPSMAGASGDVAAYLVRNQRYVAFTGPSVNNYLTVDGAFIKDNSKSGFGVQVAHQSHGLQQQLSSSLTYSYKVQFRKTDELRFGLNAGILDNRIDVKSINVMQTDDPYLLGLRPNTTAFDMNFGLSYRWKVLRFGFAIPQLIGNKITYDKQSARGYYRLARHYMATAEYDFQLGRDLIVKPYVLVRYVPGAPLQYDVMAHAEHSGIGWVSVGYKSDYSIQANVGFRIFKQFKVGYSYEYLIGSMKNYSVGAHNELMLGFIFRPKRKDIVKTVEKVVEVEKIVEKETIVEVENEETLKENEELKRRNRELEELLRQSQAEADEQKKENKELQKQTITEVVPEPQIDTLPETAPEPEKIPYAKGYHFIELDKTDSPDGFYVISGVFSSKKNAETVLNKTREDFDNAHLVTNQKNGFYYVVITYTLDQGEAEKAAKKYKRTARTDAWILNYRLERN